VLPRPEPPRLRAPDRPPRTGSAASTFREFGNPRAFKGGAVEWVHWQTGTARLLARLVAGRTSGPVFLAERTPTRQVPTADLDPASGRARLSYRRAAHLFRQTTGWTLHQLRHSALTHEAEDGTNTPMLLARSRHASVRSLERYARSSPEAVGRHVAGRDPAARRRP
jgi:integrase/recombinase XerD